VCTEILVDPGLGKDTTFDFTSVNHTLLSISVESPEGKVVNVPILTYDAPYYKCEGVCLVSTI